MPRPYEIETIPCSIKILVKIFGGNSKAQTKENVNKRKRKQEKGRVLSCSTRPFLKCCARNFPGEVGYCTVTETVAVCVVKPADVPVTVNM